MELTQTNTIHLLNGTLVKQLRDALHEEQSTKTEAFQLLEEVAHASSQSASAEGNGKVAEQMRERMEWNC